MKTAKYQLITADPSNVDVLSNALFVFSLVESVGSMLVL